MFGRQQLNSAALKRKKIVYMLTLPHSISLVRVSRSQFSIFLFAMPHRDENRIILRRKKPFCLYYLLFCLRASFKSDLRTIMFASARVAVPYTDNKNAALYLFALCSTTMSNAVRVCDSVVLEYV